jgi:hypothetical protein
LQLSKDSLVPTDVFMSTSGQAPEMTENITEIETDFF